jgi:hypothetical protein
MSIYKTRQGMWVIGSGGTWLPGVYESERAARYAFRFPDERLRALRDEVNEREPDCEKRIVTFAMLQELRKKDNT